MQLTRRSRSACFRRPLRYRLPRTDLGKTKSLVGLTLGIIFTNFWQSLAHAQIIPDTTLDSESSVVNSNVELNQKLVDLIEGGAIRDANLFHSFEEFNLTEGQNVYFVNPTGINNILTRVTGVDASQIFGTLGVNGTANLFLLNPNGIMFGPNAQLDISGSFVASTADSIAFANGLEFSATNPEVPPLLTINVPLGLQYGATPGDINLERTSASQPDLNLTVTPGKTIALVGGDLNLQRADLEAPGGRIELGSVAGEGLVSLTPTAEGGWELGYEDVVSFGDIQTTRSFISTSIEGETEFPLPSSDGTIAFRAASLDIGRSSVVRTNTFTDFPSGDINIDVQSLTIRDGAGVSARTFSDAPGGNLTVNASETIEIKDSLNFGQFALLSSLFTSTGGVSSTNNFAGNAGNLTINTKRLILETGGSISTASFSGGNAGNLLVNASELVQINGTTIDNEDRPSILTASSSGTGIAGDIIIITSTLQIEDGAILRSRTAADSDAGNIILQVADSITLTGENSGIFANTSPDSLGNGGSISITPTREIKIQEQAQIAVNSQGSGQGGDIELKTDFLTLDQGLISAETASNLGGNLTLAVDNLLLLRNGSNITATAGTLAAGGDGGNINLNTNFLVAPPTEDNNITANAFTGQGGNVQITAQGIFGIEFRPEETSFSDITASSQFGINGIVVLNTPDVDVISNLVKLPDQPINLQPLEGCRASSGQGSSFVRTGKGGLPSNPDNLLESSQVLDDLSLPQEWSKVTSEVPKQIVKATGWIINEEGMVELVAHKIGCL